MVSQNKTTFQNTYAHALLKRTVAKLRKSAKNRARRKYAQAYRIAADTIAQAAQ